VLKDRLRLIFDVFSKRRREAKYPPDSVPEPLRNKILFLCRDIFSNRWREHVSRSDYTSQFWEEIHRSLQYLHGRPKLSPHPLPYPYDTPAEDAIQFLLRCEPQEFLDFVELMFRVQCLFHVIADENELVDALNELFKSEGAPFQLTPIVKQEEDASGPPPFHHGRIIRTVAYPKVVWVEEEVTFTEAVAPILSVLADPAYRSANLEFRDALEEYRKGDYGDCLTKCGSAFESVMKVLCAKNGWPFAAQDTAAPLLRTILGNTSLDGFFEQPLILIATLRNRLSKAHGAGTATRQVERHVAQYAITSTAAAILLLVHEAG
jgi:hypothetical protein